ncbi:hypothetical protein V6N13_104371 [Hibiscus sabdariffa]
MPQFSSQNPQHGRPLVTAKELLNLSGLHWRKLGMWGQMAKTSNKLVKKTRSPTTPSSSVAGVENGAKIVELLQQHAKTKPTATTNDMETKVVFTVSIRYILCTENLKGIIEYTGIDPVQIRTQSI